MYAPVAKLMPHGTAIRAVEELVAWEPGKAHCRMTVRADNPFVREGKLAAVTMLEYLAQAVAACLGQEAYEGGEGVRVGMLIGVRKMDLHVAAANVGDAVELRVERVRGSDEVSTFKGEASGPSGPIADAMMTVFHAEKPPA